MAIQTYKFYESGSIPGVPGIFYAGQIVKIDTDTNEVIDQYMMTTEEEHEGTEAEEEDKPALPLDTTPPPAEVEKPTLFDAIPPTVAPAQTEPTPQEGG